MRQSRRSFLTKTLVGVPTVAGVALITKGGLVVADLWWREQNVGQIATNTGRAQALHGAGAAAGAPETVERDSSPEANAIVPSPDDPVVTGNVANQPTVGRLRIESIGLDAPIVRVGIAYRDGQPYWQTANRAVGWHEGSGTPGDATGNVVISGHISSRNEGAVFRRLPTISLGDESRVTIASSHTVTYRVVDKLVVNPSDAWVMDQTKAPIATFITCVPDGVYSQRLVVVSELVPA